MDPFDEEVPFAGRVAWDVRRVVDRLTGDPAFLIDWWTIWQDREPLVTALSSHWRVWNADDVLSLSPDQLAAVSSFHDARIGVLLWARTTDAMPQTWAARIEEASDRLTRLGEAAIHHLGGVPEAPDRREAVPRWWQEFRR